jgi:hypothetical protein
VCDVCVGYGCDVCVGCDVCDVCVGYGVGGVGRVGLGMR